MNGLRFTPAQLVQAQKTVRGLREASIPVADANAVVGVHRIQFQSRYQFGLFASPDVNSPTQLGSLIHGGVSSRGILQGTAPDGGYAAYFGSQATVPTSQDDELSIGIDSPPDVAGNPIQVPMLGANKLAASLWVQSAAYNTDFFTLSLYRAVTPADSVAYMGSPTSQSLLVAQWGPVCSAPTGDNHPIFNFTGYELPTGSSFWLELKNETSASSLNILAGSIFFHG